MGGNGSKSADANGLDKAAAEAAEKKSQLLSTGDLKTASAFVASGGKTTESKAVTAKDFEKIFELKAKAAGLMNQNETFQQIKDNAITQQGADAVGKLLDMDGDGKVDPKDFEIMFQKYMSFLDQNTSSIDQYIPFLGQCAFGIGVGYGVGYAARSVYSYKVPIVLVGLAGYSAVQYAAQQEFVNKEVLMAAGKAKVKEMVDVNKDGDVNFGDVEHYVQDQFKIVATKLGPGGFAPGMAGVGTFLAGIWMGIRPRPPRR